MDQPMFAPTFRVEENAWGDRFEAAWRAGATPHWEEYLPGPEETCDPERIFFLLQTDIEHRAKARLPALLAEPYFQHPRLSRADARLDEAQQAELIRWEYQLRWKNGERVRSGDYLAAFPQHAERLRDLRPRWTCPRCRQPGALEDEAAEALCCRGCSITFPLGEIFRPLAVAWGPATDKQQLPRVPGYEILELLGRGGMGVVYKARQVSLKRLVALKMIRAGAGLEGQELARFQTEAEAMAALHHTHIVQVYEVGTSEGRPYFSQELVTGGGLDRFLAGTPQAPRLAAATVERLARAMHFAHQRGIVHRDLKPANILLAPPPEGGEMGPDNKDARAGDVLPWVPKIADFGLAKRLYGDDAQTQSGAIVGTPSYMAPEQAAGKKTGRGDVGPPADVYALGAILYEMLAGRAPFRAATPWDTIQQVLGEDPVPPSRLQSTVPRDLDTICLKCLQKEPGQRYGSALALADDLRRVQAGEPIQARPVGAWERGVKWAKRRPALAAALGLGLLTALALTGIVVGQVYAVGLRQARDFAREKQLDAETQREEADRQRTLAEQRRRLFRRLQYFTQMGLAQRVWNEGEVSRMLELLEAYRPQAGAFPNSEPDDEDLRGFEWHYLQRFHRLQLTLGGFTQDILDVAFSPDGTRLASASWDGQVRLWDTASGKEILTLKAAAQLVYCVAFSPDGKRLAAGAGNRVQVWDVAGGQELATVLRDSNWVYSVAFSPDGTRLASAGKSNKVMIRETATGKELFTLQSRGDAVYPVRFSPDGKSLAGVGEKEVTVWDAGTGAVRFVLPASAGVYFGPDSTQLVTVGNDRGGQRLQVKVWDALTGELQQTVNRPPRAFNQVAFRPDGKWLALGGEDQAIAVWDPAVGQDALSLKGHSPQPKRVYLTPSKRGINALAFSADGRRLASAGEDRTVRIWDVAEREETLALPGFAGPLASVHFSADGRRLVAVGRESRMVRISDMATGKEIRQLDSKQGGKEVAGAVLSPNGQRLAVVYNGPESVRIWDVGTGEEIATLHGLLPPNEGRKALRSADSVAFSPGGQRLAVAVGMVVQVWDAAAGKLLATLGKQEEPAKYALTCVAFSPDGQWVAAASDDHPTIRIWDAEKGAERYALTGHRGGVRGLAFSPDGTLLASASADSTVILWNTSTGKEGPTFRGHSAYFNVNAVAFSPDGTRVISGGDDQTVRLWDAATGQEALVLKGHGAGVDFVTFAADGQRLYSLGDEGVLRVWDGRPVR